MSTALHSFIDIFGTTFGDGDEAVVLNKIMIPIIQRDYAQGRKDPDVQRVRSRFLDSLYKAVTEKPITLDFVYGDIDREGVMTPLDGQQRLTTLFLLHWFAAKKDAVQETEYAFLQNFSYETRYSARNFCIDLVKFCPTFVGAVSKEIINQAWFPLEWKKDPTINAMLVMLDAIQQKFSKCDGLWESLTNRAITFYFLPIRDMGLTDELYIKMNSRGKPLTQFEHFKAELEREMRGVDGELADRITRKIDREWTDLLWTYRNGGSGTADDYIIDDEFLRYFKFICDVICYRQGDSPVGKSNDEFDLLERYFSSSNPKAKDNIETFETFFDCWCNISNFKSPSDFLNDFMASKHRKGSIIVDNKNKIDIFDDCLHAYSDKSGRIRQFPLNRIVLLYAITSYLQNSSEVAYPDFRRRIRIVNNLIQNSEDEVSDRTDRNRIPAILQEVDAIIKTGEIDETIDNNFNVNQLIEEKEKIEYLKEHPDDADILFKLEDNPMLNGQISIVGLDNLNLADRFEMLFTCRWDNIDCALMATGDYGQMESNKWRFQYGSKSMYYAWNELFHKSGNIGFEKTKSVLITLLSKQEVITNESLKAIISDFILSCEAEQKYPFRYYYVKYSEYRPGAFGKLSNSKSAEAPYMFSVLQTKTQWSSNTYMPFLKAAVGVKDEALSRDHAGQRLIYGDKHIICVNSAYQVRKNDGEEVIDTIEISQNDEGIDTENRVMKLRKYIEEHF